MKPPCLPLALLAFLAAVPVAAADDGVYTDPAQADADFAFQGEYVGWQRSQPSHRSSERVGLQVIARGDGRFDAVKLWGGLPGGGWAHALKYPLAGERTGSFVELRGDQYDMLIENGTATIYARDGRIAGELQRIERVSPTMGLLPPDDAVILFDGSATEKLRNPRLTDDGLLRAGTETTAPYGDFRLHAEFLIPYQPAATGQARGNSGFYLQGRYEVQVLDSFGLEGVENECGALYRTRAPLVNMCLPPLQWQTYDIDFRAARFDDAGRKTQDAVISVWHNGVAIHRDYAIPNKTGAGQAEGPQPLPTKLQDHGNPVVFRNIWLIETDGEAEADWPPLPPSSVPPLPLLPLLPLL